MQKIFANYFLFSQDHCYGVPTAIVVFLRSPLDSGLVSRSHRHRVLVGDRQCVHGAVTVSAQSESGVTFSITSTVHVSV